MITGEDTVHCICVAAEIMKLWKWWLTVPSHTWLFIRNSSKKSFGKAQLAHRLTEPVYKFPRGEPRNLSLISSLGKSYTCIHAVALGERGLGKTTF